MYRTAKTILLMLIGFFGSLVVIDYAALTHYENKQTSSAPASTQVAAPVKVASSDDAPPDAATKIVERFTGCRDRADSDRLTKFVMQGDRDGFARFHKVATSSGACRVFSVGSEVFIDEKSLTTYCLRPRGELDCYWTPKESVLGMR